MRISGKKNNKAFSLIEVMMALALFFLISMATIKMVDLLNDNAFFMQRDVQQLREVHANISLFRRVLRTLPQETELIIENGNELVFKKAERIFNTGSEFDNFSYPANELVIALREAEEGRSLSLKHRNPQYSKGIAKETKEVDNWINLLNNVENIEWKLDNGLLDMTLTYTTPPKGAIEIVKSSFEIPTPKI